MIYVIDELEKNENVFREFSFSNNLNCYKEVFGLENMIFLFLEELSDVESNSIKELSKLLKLERDMVHNLLNNKKNVQIKKTKSTKSTIKNKKLLKIWHFYNKHLIFLRPMIKNFNFLKSSYVLNELTIQQKNKVFNLYKNENECFANEYNLSEAMKRLGYY